MARLVLFELSQTYYCLSTNEKLLVSWQFSGPYGVTKYGSGWRKNVVNQCLEFAAGLDPGYTTLQLGWTLATLHYSWAGPWLLYTTAGLGLGDTMLAATFSLPSESEVNHKFDITVTQKVRSVCCMSRPQSPLVLDSRCHTVECEPHSALL